MSSWCVLAGSFAEEARAVGCVWYVDGVGVSYNKIQYLGQKKGNEPSVAKVAVTQAAASMLLREACTGLRAVMVSAADENPRFTAKRARNILM